MGFNIIIERDVVDNIITKIYKCSNCGLKILKAEYEVNAFHDINWNVMSSFCSCGEKLFTNITTFVPIIDEMEYFENQGE